MKRAAAVLFLLMAGCASPSPRAVPAGQLSARSADPVVRVRGWGDLAGRRELDAWIGQSLSAAPSLQAAEQAERVEAAGGELAASGRRPAVSLEADYRGGRTRTMVTQGETIDVEPVAARASAVWDLDAFGRVRSQIGAARFSELAAGHLARDQQVAYAARMAGTAVMGQLINDQLRIRSEVVKSHAAIVAYTDGRLKAGLAKASDLEQVKALGQAAELELIRAKEALGDLQAQWQYLAHGKGIPALRELGAVSPGVRPAPAAEQVLHTYAVNRPDVQAAHALWQSARHRMDGAKADRLPTLSALARADGEGPSVVDEPESWVAWAGVRLSIPVLSPGSRAALAVEQERVGLQESLYREAVKLAARDLAQAYTRRVHAEDAWHAAQEVARQLKERHASAKRQFEQGRIAIPEYERSRIAWLKADESARERSADVMLRNIDLARACGGPVGADK